MEKNKGIFKIRIGLQIRPLIWMLIPTKKIEKKILSNYYRYKFLCFELVIRKEK